MSVGHPAPYVSRVSNATALAKYPHLTQSVISNAKLPFQIARNPDASRSRTKSYKTYALEDVEALAARKRHSDPSDLDPNWVAVLSGARYTAATAQERFPSLLTKENVGAAKLPFVRARKPKLGDARPSDVKTYAPEDIEALAARLAASPHALAPRLARRSKQRRPEVVATGDGRQPLPDESSPGDETDDDDVPISALIQRLARQYPSI